MNHVHFCRFRAFKIIGSNYFGVHCVWQLNLRLFWKNRTPIATQMIKIWDIKQIFTTWDQVIGQPNDMHYRNLINFLIGQPLIVPQLCYNSRIRVGPCYDACSYNADLAIKRFSPLNSSSLDPRYSEGLKYCWNAGFSTEFSQNDQILSECRGFCQNMSECRGFVGICRNVGVFLLEYVGMLSVCRDFSEF